MREASDASMQSVGRFPADGGPAKLAFQGAAAHPRPSPGQGSGSLLDRFLNRLVVAGRLSVIGPDGYCRDYGGVQIPGVAPCVIRIADPKVALRLAVHPSLAFGEAYMDGGLTIEQGGIFDLLGLFLFNIGQARLSGRLGWPDRLAGLFRRVLMHNPLSRSRRNVAHHYDLSGQLYRLFLDEDRQYSCAYFAHPEMALEDAQRAKKAHIAKKLLLNPGQHVLDIGCGWGGMALYLAREFDVRVTGITLSEEQVKEARLRAEAMGLADRVTFRLCDYRTLDGRFDRIVSVGMFEHVGVGHYPRFFGQIRDLLADDGVAVLHSIGRSDGPGLTNAWIRKYIFPGGYAPALSEALPPVERAGLTVTDIEILRIHYAKTLREWRQRFTQHIDAVRALYDDRFCRMWEFYLAACEASFLYDNLMVFQMQMSKSMDAVPPTRAYMYA